MRHDCQPLTWQTVCVCLLSCCNCINCVYICNRCNWLGSINQEWDVTANHWHDRLHVYIFSCCNWLIWLYQQVLNICYRCNVETIDISDCMCVSSLDAIDWYDCINCYRCNWLRSIYQEWDVIINHWHDRLQCVCLLLLQLIDMIVPIVYISINQEWDMTANHWHIRLYVCVFSCCNCINCVYICYRCNVETVDMTDCMCLRLTDMIVTDVIDWDQSIKNETWLSTIDISDCNVCLLSLQLYQLCVHL